MPDLVEIVNSYIKILVIYEYCDKTRIVVTFHMLIMYHVL
jgi:hypothetical protein